MIAGLVRASLTSRRSLGALGLLGVVACGGVSASTDARAGDGSTGGADGGVDGPPGEVALDILFVIDNSGTMAEEQNALVAAFPQFVEALENLPGGLPSLHIGIVTSDFGTGAVSVPACSPGGDGGLLQNLPRAAGCSAPTDRFIRNEPGAAGGERVVNYPGTLADTFSCIAQVGAMGCGFEQHLASMSRALDGSVIENVGFLRPEAKLAVVVIADEDDCSASNPSIYDRNLPDEQFGPFGSFRCTMWGVECGGLPVTDQPATYADCKSSSSSPYIVHTRVYADELRALKADPGDVLFAAIVGDPDPFVVAFSPLVNQMALSTSCSSKLGTAVPGARFDSLAAEFGERGFRGSICADDLGPALQGVAAFLVSRL